MEIPHPPAARPSSFSREQVYRTNFARRASGVSGVCRQHLIEKAAEIVQPSAGNDYRIATAMGFLGNPEKPSAVILPKLDEEVFALNLEFARFNDIIHFPYNVETIAIENQATPVHNLNLFLPGLRNGI